MIDVLAYSVRLMPLFTHRYIKSSGIPDVTPRGFISLPPPCVFLFSCVENTRLQDIATVSL